MRPTRAAVLYSLLLVLYAALFAESYARIFGSSLFGDRGRSYIHHPYLYQKRSGIPFRTNGWGLRGRDFTTGKLRIVAFGGSATESADQPEKETWPARLEGYLNARYGKAAVQVVNAGSSGLSSGHYLAHLNELAGPLGIDVAVIYTGGNDADRLARYRRILRVGHIDDPAYGEVLLEAFAAPDPARLAATSADPLLRHSYLALYLRSFFVRNILQNLRILIEHHIPRQRLHDKYRRLEASPDYPVILARGRKEYVHNLDLMLEVARRNRVTPIFVTMPKVPMPSDQELASLNEALVAFCRSRKAALVDLASEPGPAPGGWLTRGTHHFNRLGADRAGGRISAAVIDLLDGRIPGGEMLRRRARARGLPIGDGAVMAGGG